MPISPENKARYPANWKSISTRIRFDRAQGRCEFIDSVTGKRCEARHGEAHPVTKSKVFLTTAHLDHAPENCDDDNLKAGCQRCHLRYDAVHHAKSRKARQDKKRARVLMVARQLAFAIECATGKKVGR
ncbi:MAG: hypothetical protein U5K75_10945 [Ahrensia sp.]|nr:hypothetical protein [Ahrensia sp.]